MIWRPMKSQLEPLESSHEEFAAVAGDELSKNTRSCPQIAPTVRGKAANAPLMPVLHSLGDMGSHVQEYGLPRPYDSRLPAYENHGASN